MKEYAFKDLKISDNSCLFSLKKRSKCKKCDKSRMYYCYTCFLPLPSLEAVIPTVNLPVDIDIIKHPGEVCGKSTAIHAAVLAPRNVQIYIYPDMPLYDSETTVLIFPDQNALTMNEFFAVNKCHNSENILSDYPNINCSPNSNVIDENLSEPNNRVCNDFIVHYEDLKEYPLVDNDKFSSKCNDETLIHRASENNNSCLNTTLDSKEKNSKYKKKRISKVIFIDCTWLQTYKIVTDQRLNGLTRIKLNEYETKFWRYQRNKPPTFLSTIEAIYFFVCELADHQFTALPSDQQSTSLPSDHQQESLISDYQYSSLPNNQQSSSVPSDQQSSSLPSDQQPSPSDGAYDDLLFFFKFFYEKIGAEADGKGRILKAHAQRQLYGCKA